MKYFKLIEQLGWASFKKGIIYTEDFKTKDNLVVGNLATIGLNPQDWEEVTEKEYWQQELDAGKLVKGGYYTVNQKYNHNIFKYNSNENAEYYFGGDCDSFKRNGGSFDSNNVTRDYRLATDDEIEYLEYCNSKNKFISKEEFMKNKEFKLPEKWVVKVTPKNADILTKWKIEVSNGRLNDPASEYEYVSYEGSGEGLNHEYTEITFEQFQKYVLKQEEEMSDKKIIGYKLIKPEYEKAALKITGCDTYGWSSNSKFDMTATSIGAKRAVDAEILDKWFEPVFEEEYKVGDWVYVVSGGAGAYGANDFVGQICSKSTAVNVNYGGEQRHVKAELYVVNQNKSWGLCKDYKVRKATDVEIEQSKIPVINIRGYEARLSGDEVSFGCQTYDRDFVLQLGEFLENSGLKIESKDDIMKVVEYFKNN